MPFLGNLRTTVDIDYTFEPEISAGGRLETVMAELAAYEFQPGFSGYLPLVTRSR